MAKFGICAFCTQYKEMTDEDVVARWMRSIIPRSGYEKHQRGQISTLIGRDGFAVPLLTTSKANGHAASLKIPWVCASCNNGWMSDLENKNKAVLTTLITGKRCILMPFMLRHLVGWAAKTSMILEYHRPDKVAITQAERTLLMATLLPPAHWNIWIAPYIGPQWVTRMYHQSLYLPAKDPAKRTSGDRRINTQTTMLVLGHVAFYVISSTSEGHTFKLGNEQFADFRRIWPLPQGIEIWPRGRAMENDDLVRIIDSLNRYLGTPVLGVLL